MDPDETLARLRALLVEWHQTDPMDTFDLSEVGAKVVEHLEALDEWLTEGGFPPMDWNRGGE